MAKKKDPDVWRIEIQPVHLTEVRLRIVGTTPLFQNRMSAKVKQGLLVGTKKKTAVEKQQIKHHPLREFTDSAELVPHGPTALGLLVTAVKSAMCDAAIETAGLTKAGTQRLLFMPGDHAPLYGIPQLRMDVVRSADMAKTPDVRTRAFLPKWGAEIAIRFVSPQMTAQSVVSLLINAGILIGVGDYRQQKGKGAYGSFRVLTEDMKDHEWSDLVKNQGRAAQLAAMKKPEPANAETESLLEFWAQENRKRAA